MVNDLQALQIRRNFEQFKVLILHTMVLDWHDNATWKPSFFLQQNFFKKKYTLLPIFHENSTLCVTSQFHSILGSVVFFPASCMMSIANVGEIINISNYPTLHLGLFHAFCLRANFAYESVDRPDNSVHLKTSLV